MKQESTVTITTAENGTLLNIAGGTYRIVLSGEQTGGAYAVIEMSVPPGAGPAPHAHPGFQESFHVLEGSVEVKTENQTALLQQGDFINIPMGGIIHQFKNKTGKPAKLWCVVVPAGLDDFFREVSQVAAPAGATAPPSPAQLEQITVIAAKYGQTLYPPDYLK